MTRSTYARCHAERGADSTCLIPIAFTCSTKSCPKMRSRSRSRYRGALSHGKASRSCCAVHSSVGMCSDSEVKHASPIMRKHEENVEDLKPDPRHGKEVHRHKALQVVVEENPPCLGRRFPV